MRATSSLIFVLLLAACAKNPIGQSKSDCEKTPELCASVRETYKKSNGPVSPPPSDAALQRGDAMRVWVAPMRGTSGVLTNSGIIYLE